MKLNKIKGNTYYIDAPTNIGVYIFKDKNCLLIDSGIDNGQARKISDILDLLHPKYIINTHSHIDHCGGNYYFKNNYPGCVIYSSETAKLYIENPILHPTILFSAAPLKKFNKVNKTVNVDYVLDEGIVKINDEKFKIISLQGHAQGQIGIITPQSVCFLADSIFSQKIIKKYSFPYLFDIEKSIETLNKLKQIEADYFVISHCDEILDKNELLKLIDKNICNIKKYINQIMELINQPFTREELLENLIILNELPIDFMEYYHNQSSLSAFITYLYDKNMIDCYIEDGKMYYFKKP